MIIKSKKLYFVMILTLRKSNLRDMMDRGILTLDLKSEVLKKLKPLVNDNLSNHGDLKVFILSSLFLFVL